MFESFIFLLAIVAYVAAGYLVLYFRLWRYISAAEQKIEGNGEYSNYFGKYATFKAFYRSAVLTPGGVMFFWPAVLLFHYLLLSVVIAIWLVYAIRTAVSSAAKNRNALNEQ